MRGKQITQESDDFLEQRGSSVAPTKRKGCMYPKRHHGVVWRSGDTFLIGHHPRYEDSLLWFRPFLLRGN